MKKNCKYFKGYLYDDHNVTSLHMIFSKTNAYVKSRGESRTAATSKMERFAIITNGFQLLTIIPKCSILNVAAVLDLHRKSCRDQAKCIYFLIQNDDSWRNIKLFGIKSVPILRDSVIADLSAIQIFENKNKTSWG